MKVPWGSPDSLADGVSLGLSTIPKSVSNDGRQGGGEEGGEGKEGKTNIKRGSVSWKIAGTSRSPRSSGFPCNGREGILGVDWGRGAADPQG